MLGKDIFNSKKLFIFDYDDTLVQTINCKWAAIKETGKRFFNIELTNEKIKQFWGVPFRDLFTELFGTENLEKAIKEYTKISNEEFPMAEHPGALNLVNNLLNRSLKVAVISASKKDLIITDLAKLRFPVERFYFLQASEDTKFNKPDPRVFDAIFEKTGEDQISKSEMIYIGDSMKDYAASHAAKIDFIGLVQGLASEEEFNSVDADYVNGIDELVYLTYSLPLRDDNKPQK